jgi:HSP20 family protein
MAVVARRENATPQTSRARDPFASLARELFGWDPYATSRPSAFSPHFEVKESEDHYAIRADLPGVKESDVDISMHGNVLTISGSRAAEERNQQETYYVYERQYGSFSRAFSLPDEADPEKVDASLKDGVLSVRVAKRAHAKPRRIELKK